MKNLGVLIFLGFLVAFVNSNAIIKQKDAEILVNIIIYVSPPPDSGEMEVKCWFDDDVHGPFRFTSPGSFTFEFVGYTWKEYRCNAYWNLLILPAFSVWGGEIPFAHNNFLINEEGKKRVTQNGSPVNDFFGPWI